ncbi:hypothetical protein M514_09025 [Trichuris suis]|nr:hypothetical protein M514_09025 [Trichuris suis]
MIRMRHKETPDAFLSGPRELALLAGGVPDKVLASAFIDGLPEKVQESLLAGARMETLSLDELLTRSRAMLARVPRGSNGLTDLAAAAHSSAPVTLSSGSHYRCFACGGINHFARECPTRRQEASCPMRANRRWGWPRGRSSGPYLEKEPGPTESGNADREEVDSVVRCALVDSGCKRCIVYAPCCRKWETHPVCLKTISGDELRCIGMGYMRLMVPGARATEVDVIVSDRRPLGFDFVLGMSAIRLLGGALLDSEGYVQFNPFSTPACAGASAVMRIDEKNFVVTYDTTARSWTAAWKWANGNAPEVLQNAKMEYPPAAASRAAYEEELMSWIRNGWLIQHDERKFGPARALIPLMAVVQRNKGKVRPVLDFRELNTHIDTFTANCDVCAHKLREWRRQGTDVSILDLHKAYLQVRVDESLWPYRTVILHGRRYCLTRLGFGLNVAPTIMKAVVGHVLSLAPHLKKGTSACIDDIFVNQSIDPERVTDGARVLGLKLWGEQGALLWSRGNEISGPPKNLTRRTVFSHCGELVGHYPVCGWLRAASAFAKREANRVTERWDEPIHEDRIRAQLSEIANAVKTNDPVHGRSDVSSGKARIWVDVSMLALSVALEVGGSVIEDGTWLRPDEARHINMAELDAVIKGLNLALSWEMKEIELMTDSATVHQWIEDGLSGRTRLQTKAANEILIRRRIETILALVKEYDLKVPKRWLAHTELGEELACATVGALSPERLITEVHRASDHPGVRRTLYFARRRDPRISKRDVSSVVGSCDVCRSVDPALAKWRHGVLEVPRLWQRVGIDVAHLGSELYLTLIDCVPSRLAIWRRLSQRSSGEVAQQLESIFCERGAPDELLADNDTAFRSRRVTRLAERWGTRLRFRCAYAPSGNGIIERCYRTVKVIAARTGCSAREAVYRYNLMPRDDRSSATAPANPAYRYTVTDRNEATISSGDQNTHGLYMVGDAVWVKSRDGRCDTRYDSGVVTRLVSDQAVEINGVPRHVRDIRRRVSFPSPPARPTPNVNDDGDFNGSTTEWNREPQTIMLTTTTDPQPPQPLVTGRSEGEAQDSASSERAAVSECVESSGNATENDASTRLPVAEALSEAPEEEEERVGPTITATMATDVSIPTMSEPPDQPRLRRSARVRREHMTTRIPEPINQIIDCQCKRLHLAPCKRKIQGKLDLRKAWPCSMERCRPTKPLDPFRISALPDFDPFKPSTHSVFRPIQYLDLFRNLTSRDFDQLGPTTHMESPHIQNFYLEEYPIPHIHEVTDKLFGKRIFAKIDLVRAYQQIPVRAADVPKSAIITPFGLYEYVRMTFCLRNAAQTFQRFIDEVTCGLDFWYAYLDDVLVARQSEEGHEAHLTQLFQRMNDYGVGLNPDKSTCYAAELGFLRCHISTQGIRPLGSKVAAIRQFPQSTMVQELRQTVGCVNFYRHFIPRVAVLLSPLERLLAAQSKDGRLILPSHVLEAFESAKRAFAEAALLTHPKDNAPLSLVVDASTDAAGTVLQQKLNGR